MTYKRKEDGVIFEYLRKQNLKTTILDVGARKGSWYRNFKLVYPNLPVHMFEPTPNIVEYLNKHYGNMNHISIHGEALSDCVGEFEFHLNLDKPAWSGLTKHPKHKYKTIRVPVKTIDSYNFPELSFIKIDVEGNEYKTLNGAIKTIQRHKPIIYFECADVHLTNYTNTSADVYNFFIEQGYTVYDLDMKKLTVDDFCTHTYNKPSFYHNFIAHV